MLDKKQQHNNALKYFERSLIFQERTTTKAENVCANFVSISVFVAVSSLIYSNFLRYFKVSILMC